MVEPWGVNEKASKLKAAILTIVEGLVVKLKW